MNLQVNFLRLTIALLALSSAANGFIQLHRIRSLQGTIEKEFKVLGEQNDALKRSNAAMVALRTKLEACEGGAKQPHDLQMRVDWWDNGAWVDVYDKNTNQLYFAGSRPRFGKWTEMEAPHDLLTITPTGSLKMLRTDYPRNGR